MLQPQHSRDRQRRLLQVLHDRKLDAAVLGLPHHVYWASAHRASWLQESAFVLFADGRSWLATANAPNTGAAAADDVVSFEASWMGTQRQEQPAVAADLALQELARHKGDRIGIDASAVGSQLAMSFLGECAAIDSDLWQLRRRKHADELDLMRTAIRASEAMHRRAREIIEPGVSELAVFNALHAAAVETTGEPMTALLGNDYACGVGGGPPRKDRVAQAGQIYILDVGPTYRGYFADNARAIAVDRKPTDEQLKAWQTIVDAFPIVERMAKPGARCREIFAAVEEHYRSKTGSGLPHHLGHGVGLQPHEFPHLNPKWDDVLIEGEIFTAEPGLYAPEINGGIRIENQYLVTKDGVENLVNVPMELV
jgi:Xaa-Pro aminopeptidase